MLLRIFAVTLAGSLLAAGCSSPEPSLRVVSPRDGQEVISPVEVLVEVGDFELGTAGSFSEGRGHLHILVDVPCVPVGRTIPSGERYVHLWRGESSTRLELEPGEHDLCIQAADGTHVALDLSEQLSVTVVEG